MPEELTIQKLMSLMPKAFVPEKAGDLDAVIQFNLGGEGGGDWAVTISEGSCSVSPGVAENPKLTLSAQAADYLDIITGKVNAMSAFAEGKIKLKGDLGLAMKLMTFFKLPA
jgi:putative sterol carrier protein